MSNERDNKGILDFVKDYEKKQTSNVAAPDGKDNGVKFMPSAKKEVKIIDIDDEFGIDEFLSETSVQEEQEEVVNYQEKELKEEDIFEKIPAPQALFDIELEDDEPIEIKAEEKKTEVKMEESVKNEAVMESKEEVKQEKDIYDSLSFGMEDVTKKKPVNTKDFIPMEEVKGSINDISVKEVKTIAIEPKKKENKSVAAPTKSIEPELTKKELKQLEKEKAKQEKREKKDRALADKKKWSTYHNGFVLADGEKVVKEYRCLELINPSGTGIITLTNKRLLCSTNELLETEISNINGIMSKYKSKFSMIKLMLFFLLGALAAGCILASMRMYIDITQYWAAMPSWFNYVLYAVAGLSALFALFFLFTINRKEFNIMIYTNSLTPLVSYSGIKGKVKQKVIRVRPGREAKTIVHEIGAVILEIKSGKYN